MNTLKQNLAILGIKDKEQDIYLALVKTRIATVIDLAKATGIKRTTAYHCLEALINYGLANRIVKEDRSFYIAEDPQSALSMLIEEKNNIINAIVPELKAMFGKGSYHPEIKIYHQTEGIKKVLNNILTCDEKVARYYISEFNLEELVGIKFVDHFVAERIKRRIKSLSLRSFKYKPEREKDTTHAKQLREVRFIPENIIIKPYICIYDDKVAMVSTKEEKLGFIIQSREFAEAQKAIFDMIWNTMAI